MHRNTVIKNTQTLTGGLDHFTVSGVDMRVTANKNSDMKNFYEQSHVLESIVEIFRVCANVVIVGKTTENGVSIAVEHVDAVDPTVIEEKINELGTVPFGDSSTLDLSTVKVSKVKYDMLVEPEPVPAPTIDSGSTSIEEVAGDVVVKVQASGDKLYSLEVGHNAQGTLPEFTIYADSSDVWGDPQSASDAVDAGVEATFDNGLWTLTLKDGGAALETWKTDFGGEIKMYIVVHNTEGNASGDMSGSNYHLLEITVM